MFSCLSPTTLRTWDLVVGLLYVTLALAWRVRGLVSRLRMGIAGIKHVVCRACRYT